MRTQCEPPRGIVWKQLAAGAVLCRLAPGSRGPIGALDGDTARHLRESGQKMKRKQIASVLIGLSVLLGLSLCGAVFAQLQGAESRLQEAPTRQVVVAT